MGAHGQKKDDRNGNAQQPQKNSTTHDCYSFDMSTVEVPQVLGSTVHKLGNVKHFVIPDPP
jgi:hypothetical protein